MFSIGSLVECITSFEELRKEWGFDYPLKGDILTVSNVYPHPKDKKLTLLSFYEKPNIPDVCAKTIHGKWNFKEIQKPITINLENLLKEEYAS